MPSEQSDSPASEVRAAIEQVRVLALNEEETRRHRQWLVQREEATTASHREWIESVMENDRAVQRKILAELRAIRRTLEQK